MEEKYDGPLLTEQDIIEMTRRRWNYDPKMVEEMKCFYNRGIGAVLNLIADTFISIDGESTQDLSDTFERFLEDCKTILGFQEGLGLPNPKWKTLCAYSGGYRYLLPYPTRNPKFVPGKVTMANTYYWGIHAALSLFSRKYGGAVGTLMMSTAAICSDIFLDYQGLLEDAHTPASKCGEME